MDNYNTSRDEILGISQKLSDVIASAFAFSGDDASGFKAWQRICENVSAQMAKDILRVAVVGAIKSGKSTFVNSLLEDDYLKRGAGVVTSIVTRIRKGKDRPRAALYFKSWDDVNSDIEQAMVLLPDLEKGEDDRPFDIRRDQDRQGLKAALDALTPELINENGTFNASGILVANYLAGYDQVRDQVDSENRKITFSGDALSRHKVYSGNDALAVYLKDILLEVDAPMLQQATELADCQGSDSPNPLHLAMIQDYLVLTHFIIYVISSRTGVRQADMRFLSMIRKMGIMDHLIFVVNCDFNEHDTAEDLDALVTKIRQELSLFKENPDLFVFSSLYNLMKSQEALLDENAGERLAYWRKLDFLTGLSDRESLRFLETFNGRILQDRFSLLLRNHLERLNVVATSVQHWAVLNRDILSGDLEKAEKILSKVNQHQEKIRQIKKMIRDTLDGAVQKLISELKREIDRFFSDGNSEVTGQVLAFVESYQFRPADYNSKLVSAGFNSTLYFVFQDFKQAVDRFMAESVNPPIIRFIREKEADIIEFFKTVTLPYEKMIVDSFDEYNHMISAFGITPVRASENEIQVPDMDMIKRVEGFVLPPANATMRYSARIKTDAVIRLGVFSLVKWFKKLLKKPVENEKEDALLALEQTMVRMKQETARSISYTFKNYRENIKFQYVLKLVEKTSNHVFEAISDRFQYYMTDLSAIMEQLGDKESLRRDTLNSLSEIEKTVDDLIAAISSAREKI